jgi:hypothetical protein
MAVKEATATGEGEVISGEEEEGEVILVEEEEGEVILVEEEEGEVVTEVEEEAEARTEAGEEEEGEVTGEEEEGEVTGEEEEAEANRPLLSEVFSQHLITPSPAIPPTRHCRRRHDGCREAGHLLGAIKGIQKQVKNNCQ